MKRRVLILVLLFALCLACATSSPAITVTPKSTTGYCTISNSGETVSYSGYTRSNKAESAISITLKLMRSANGVSAWTQVDSKSASKTNSNYVSASDSTTVNGGNYYKVVTTHTTRTGSTTYTSESTSSIIWID